MYSLWNGNPHNTPRAVGQIFDLSVPIPGDLDGDGDVDLSDLALLLSHYCCAGDVDGDGDTDLSDLAELPANYGV